MWPQVFFPPSQLSFSSITCVHCCYVTLPFTCTATIPSHQSVHSHFNVQIPVDSLSHFGNYNTTFMHIWKSSEPCLAVHIEHCILGLIAGFGVPQAGRFIGWLNWREKCLNTETAPKRWVSERPWISHKVIQSPEGTWKINSCTPAVPSTCFHHNLILCL